MARATFRHNIDLLDNIVPEWLLPISCFVLPSSSLCVCFATCLLDFCSNSIDFFKAREQDVMPNDGVMVLPEKDLFPFPHLCPEGSRPNFVGLAPSVMAAPIGGRGQCQPHVPSASPAPSQIRAQGPPAAPPAPQLCPLHLPVVFYPRRCKVDSHQRRENLNSQRRFCTKREKS